MDDSSESEPIFESMNGADDSAQEILSAREEAEQVIESETSAWPLSDGDSMSLVSARWWAEWKAYTGFTVEDDRACIRDVIGKPRPGPIDNSPLIKKPVSPGAVPELLNDLKEGEDEDYFLLFEQTYQKLHKWYGGGPTITREVTAVGASLHSTKVDVYPFKLHVLRTGNKEGMDITISRSAKIAELKTKACKVLGVQEADCQLWDYWSSRKHENLEDKLHLSLEEMRIMDSQHIYLEENGEQDSAESPLLEISSPQSPAAPLLLMGPPNAPSSMPFPSTSFFEDGINQSLGKARGLAGLGNLGNTCFMNSSLQCLAHTGPLMRVFLSEDWRADLNRDNPLGNGGLLAEAYAALVKKLWQGDVSSVVPRHFKAQLGRFAPQFAGYNQQDSQELLAFLLDGLHEDLNRIQKKPYIEEKDSEGRPDEDVAEEAWRNYRARNDSVIVDHFQGLYKSTLVCPKCQQRSVKFDPFMYLSLPLPASKLRTIRLTLVHTDGSQPPMRHAFQVPKTGTVRQLYEEVGKALDLGGAAPEGVLMIAEISSCRIAKKLDDPAAKLTGVRDSAMLVAYRYPSPGCGPQSGGLELQIFHREFKKRLWSSGTHETVAAPLLLYVPERQVEELPVRQLKSGYTQEYVVEHEATQLGSVLVAALRPFKRQRDSTADAAMPAAKKSQRASPEPPASPTANGIGAAEEAATPEPKGEQDGMANGHGSAAAADADDMDASPTALKQEGWFELRGNNKPDAEAASPVDHPMNGTVPNGTLPPVQPFDMFARQTSENFASTADGTAAQPADTTETTADETPAADGSPSSNNLPPPPLRSRPFELKRCNAYGDPRVFVEPPAIRASPQYFTIDWAADGAAQYDPSLLEQPAQSESCRAADEREQAGPVPVTLDACMQAYQLPEQLAEEDSWYCGRCKEHVQAHKTLGAWSLPRLLVVHLKRFSYSRLWRDKLDSLVTFPLAGWDLSSYLLQPQDVPPMYDLYAVSNHYGGMGGGHYTAYCQLEQDGQWYLFDDSSVSRVEPQAVVTPAAYVLFYRRRDLAPQPQPQQAGGQQQAAGPQQKEKDE